MGWRELKAARERRELRRATENLRCARQSLSAARDERDRALRAPINALKREAMSYLAGRTAEAIAKVTDERVAKALVEIERSGYRETTISTDYRDWDRMTVFRIEVPRLAYHFMADIDRLARF